MRYFFILLNIVSINCFSQNDWTKDDRNNLYDNYLSILTQYKSITQEQKESISLCCLDATTAKYTKKDFSTKIEIEVKRIHESIIGQCAKNIGVELEEVIINNTEKSPTNVTSEWTKEDKIKLAKEVETYVSKYDVSEEQKEVLSLCYIQETIETISKQAYNEMITIELKQHRDKVITQCARQNKIELSNIAKPKLNSVVTKEFLISSWKTDKDFSIVFNESGTFVKTFKETFTTATYNTIENNVVNGEWFLDEKGILTLKENWIELELKLFTTKRWASSETSKFNFVSFSQDFIKMELIEGRSCCTSNGGVSTNIIQANRVK